MVCATQQIPEGQRGKAPALLDAYCTVETTGEMYDTRPGNVNQHPLPIKNVESTQANPSRSTMQQLVQ